MIMKDQLPSAHIESPESKQLVIVLSFPQDEIIRVEAFDESGKRYDLLDRETAALIGNYDVEDLLQATEHVMEFCDANGDFEFDDNDDEFEDDLDPAAFRRAESRRFIRREVRKFILAQLLRHEVLRARLENYNPAQWEILFGAPRGTCH